MDLNHDDDWYRYHGDSTFYSVGKHGLSVRMPDSGEPGEADRGEDCAESKDSRGLGEDHAGDKD